MEVTAWTDYICPWAYAARPHTTWLREQGVTVNLRGYELHPDLPPGGRPIRPGGRLDAVLDHIADECEQHGQPFVKPSRSPNSRQCLEHLEVVAAHYSAAVADLDADLARAHWVDSLPIDDVGVLQRIVERRLGRDAADDIRERWSNGEGSRLLDESRTLANELEVTATPAWRIGELTITGLHPPAQFRRWAGRLLGIAG